MSGAVTTNAVDESWPMVEEAVFRLFDELAAKGTDEHLSVGPPLAELGWSDIESEYPIQARASCYFGPRADHCSTPTHWTKVLAGRAWPRCWTARSTASCCPAIADGYRPSADAERVVRNPARADAEHRTTSCPGVGPEGHGVNRDRRRRRLFTADEARYVRPVRILDAGHRADDQQLVDASAEWSHAIAAAHRALATELVALAGEALRIAVDHVSVRIQFGAPIGSFQSPRHLLADASASLEGARALLSETWQYGGELSALTAKAAAGRAHRAVSDAAMQVCGAIGLTIEHDLHRYVTRGFQIDSLCGSYQQLEALLADRLFAGDSPGGALPAVVTLS